MRATTHLHRLGVSHRQDEDEHTGRRMMAEDVDRTQVAACDGDDRPRQCGARSGRDGLEAVDLQHDDGEGQSITVAAPRFLSHQAEHVRPLVRARLRVDHRTRAALGVERRVLERGRAPIEDQAEEANRRRCQF
ncbi:MAG: hypothetical protein ACR2JW_19390 [Thermomicrobiales bacterium]